jgi:hypothetical protein
MKRMIIVVTLLCSLSRIFCVWDFAVTPGTIDQGMWRDSHWRIYDLQQFPEGYYEPLSPFYSNGSHLNPISKNTLIAVEIS